MKQLIIMAMVSIIFAIIIVNVQSCYPTNVCLASGNADGVSSYWQTCKGDKLYFETFDNEDCDGDPEESISSSNKAYSCSKKCLAYAIIRHYDQDPDDGDEECSTDAEWEDVIYPTGCHRNGHYSYSYTCTNEFFKTEKFHGTNCAHQDILQSSRLYPGCPGPEVFYAGGKATDDLYTELLHCGINSYSITISIIFILGLIIFNL
eukprot:475795_1